MTTAAFWITGGDRYIAEACESAKSLNTHMPEIHRWLFYCNGEIPKSELFNCGVPITFDYVIPITPADDWTLTSIETFKQALREMPYDNLVYLDTDVHICCPLDGMLDLLTRYDFVGSRAPRRHSKTVIPIPEAFQEINVGVNAFRNNNRIAALFDEWADLYYTYECYGGNDQGSLRHALWVNPQVSLYIIPAEYNFRFQYGGRVNRKVYALHGRSPDIERVCQIVNAENGIRAWRVGELV